ncbi:MAG: transposase [Planctomycetes bacterium]|nr:transposase [Planctomycetota bacterium]
MPRVPRYSVVARRPGAVGFVPLPRWLVVERTFGWFEPCRRLSKDYEAGPCNSETWI